MQCSGERGEGEERGAWRDLRMGGEKNSRMVSRTTFLTVRAALGNFVLLPRGISDSRIERFNWKAIPRFFEYNVPRVREFNLESLFFK